MKTRKLNVGGVPIGGGSPITVQSMTSTQTADVKKTLEQIERLYHAGADIVRVAVNDAAASDAIAEITKKSPVPIVADIHFSSKYALEAAKNGVAKIRINPGNIGGHDNVRAVAAACKERGIPIRIGVNSGSVHKKLIEKYGGVTAEALCESALEHVELLEDCGFYDIAVALKATDVPLTVAAYREFSKLRDYPLHVGMTHTGTPRVGIIKSAAAIGSLLLDGIGDTIRVSLAAEPEEEVRVGIDILRSCGLRSGVDIIACPTCGRCKTDIIALANEVERRLETVDKPLKVAVMGCAVNGPGEARDCDVGIAGGDGEGLIFRKGEIIKKVPEADLINALFEQIALLGV